jgi:hypothetical protein
VAKKFILRPVPAHRDAAAPATPPRPVDELLAEIKALYFRTSAAAIERDFDRAIDLLKEIPLPEDRQRATVYMEGLAEMRKEWGRTRGPGDGGKKGRTRKPQR